MDCTVAILYVRHVHSVSQRASPWSCSVYCVCVYVRGTIIGFSKFNWKWNITTLFSQQDIKRVILFRIFNFTARIRTTTISTQHYLDEFKTFWATMITSKNGKSQRKMPPLEWKRWTNFQSKLFWVSSFKYISWHKHFVISGLSPIWKEPLVNHFRMLLGSLGNFLYYITSNRR